MSNRADDDMYQDPVHMELRRDYSAHLRRDEAGASDDNSTSGKSLFEKYQYLTPGMLCPC